MIAVWVVLIHLLIGIVLTCLTCWSDMKRNWNPITFLGMITLWPAWLYVIIKQYLSE